MRLKILLTVLFLLIIFSPVISRVIMRLGNSNQNPAVFFADENMERYVAETGNDANDCMTPQTACLTIQVALTKTIKPGVTIHLANGSFEGFKVGKSQSGNASKPVVIKGDGDNVVIKKAALGPQSTDNIYLFEAGYVTLQNIKTFDAVRGGIYIAFGTNIILDNFTSGNNGEWGALTAQTKNLTVINSEFFGSKNQHGFYHSTNARGAVFRNNKFHDNVRSGLQTNGDVNVTDVIIDSNIFYNNGLDPITGKTFAAALNLCGQRFTIANNLIYQNYAGGIVAWRGNCSSNISDFLITNNTLVMPTPLARSAIQVSTSSGPVKILNNHLYHQNVTQCSIELVAESDVNNVISNNNIFSLVAPNLCVKGKKTALSVWQNDSKQDLNSKTSTLDELFVNPTSNPATADYHSKDGSPAIDSGVTVSEVIKDLLGIARPQGSKYDIGAHEKTGGQSNPPPPIQVTADLSVEKVINKPTPNAGETVSYTITVTNAGPGTAKEVVIKDSLPSGLTFVSATASVGTYTNTSGNWTIGSLANGDRKPLTIVAKVNADQNNNKKIINTALASQDSDISDPRGDNTASATLTVTIPVTQSPPTSTSPSTDQSPNTNSSQPSTSTNPPQNTPPSRGPDLGVVVAVDNRAPSVGQQVTNTITVANFGLETANNVRVNYQVPEGLKFDSANSSKGTYDPKTGVLEIEKLNGGEKATLTIKTTVKSGTPLNKSISSTATVSAANTTIRDPQDNNKSPEVIQTISATPCTANCSAGSTKPTASLENADQLLPPVIQPSNTQNPIRRVWNSFADTISNIPGKIANFFRQLFGF